MLRSILVSVVALAGLVQPTLAQVEGDIPLTFEEKTLADPTEVAYWTDYLPLISTVSPRKPVIFVSELPTSNGGTYVVTMFWGPGVCGLNTCPVRIFEDGQMIADMYTCDIPTGHSLSADGEVYKACDEDFVIRDNAPTQAQ